MLPDLQQLLLKYIPSKEIKKRLINRQIKINNEAVTNNKLPIDADINTAIDLGNFIYNHIDKIPNCFNIIDIKDFFGTGETTNIKEVQFLSDYTLLSFSKKDHVIFKRIKNNFFK